MYRKNKGIKNFTKLNRSGISLIVLVITIIIILILASAIIVSISSNNPISEANKAKYENDVDSMQALFTNTVANIMTTNRGTVKITAGIINTVKDGVSETIGEVSYTVKNAKTKKNINGKIVFDKGTNTDEIIYIGKQLPIYGASKTTWYVDEEGRMSLEVAEAKYGQGKISSAPKVAEDPSKYYGEIVVNYTVQDIQVEEMLKEEDIKWQIFHSDGKNIYLIASDSVPLSTLPTGRSGINMPINQNADYPNGVSFTDVLNDYSGSADITESNPAYKWLIKYYEYLDTLKTEENPNPVSNNKNMQAVAYMMDTTMWNEKYANTSYTEYAIGGPTLEMFLASYSQIYDVSYECNVSSINGYEMRKSSSDSWINNIIIGKNDELYIKSSSNKAIGYWIVSPSAAESTYINSVTTSNIHYYGYDRYNYSQGTSGIRPIICLKSGVRLKKVDGGYEIE